MGKDSNISQKEVLKTEKFNLYCKCDVKINKKMVQIVHNLHNAWYILRREFI